MKMKRSPVWPWQWSHVESLRQYYWQIKQRGSGSPVISCHIWFLPSVITLWWTGMTVLILIALGLNKMLTLGCCCESVAMMLVINIPLTVCWWKLAQLQRKEHSSSHHNSSTKRICSLCSHLSYTVKMYHNSSTERSCSLCSHSSYHNSSTERSCSLCSHFHSRKASTHICTYQFSVRKAVVVAVVLAAVSFWQLGKCRNGGVHSSILLLLSGDIETNPGPPPFELTGSQIKTVTAILANAQNNWYELGIQLEIDSCLLETIKRENIRIKDCFLAMIREWLRMINPCPSWQQLVIALNEDIVGCHNLAIQIAQEYQVFLPAPSVTVVLKSEGLAMLGESYSMSCSVQGVEKFHASMSYQWIKDGADMVNECSPTLSFSNLSQAHAGEYSCRVSLTSPLLQHTITERSNAIDVTFPSNQDDEGEKLASEVSDNSDSTSMGIPDQLLCDMESLEEQFGSLADRTYAIITERDVDINTFRRRLLSLSVRNKILHQEFIKLILQKIKVDSNFEELWRTCCLYWTFLNYYLLEHLVFVFGDVSLKSDFKNYKEALMEFRCNTHVRDFTVYLKEMNVHLSRPNLKKLVVKLHKNWDECTLEDLEQSKDNLSQKFFLPTYFFTLMDVSPGSVCITWAIPVTIVEALKKNLARDDIVEFCVAKGIASLSVEGHVYHFQHRTADSKDLFDPSLKDDIIELEDTFAILEQSTFDHIFHKPVPIEEFIRGLTNLSIEHMDVHKTLFEKIYSEISQALTLQNAWERLSTYWNFHNCTLFQEIVIEFGDESLKVRMEDYLDKLKCFQSKTLLSDYAKYSIKIGATLPEEDFTELTVQLQECHKLDYLVKMTSSIAETFFIPKFLLNLKDVAASGLSVTWAIPTMITASVKQNMENTHMRSFCKGHSITSITVAGEEYKYSTILKYSVYLKSIYSHKEGKNLAPFKLARTEKEQVNRSEFDEFTRSTLRGDQDDVVYRKHHMEESEVGHSRRYKGKQPRLILIEGAPGVGKTTFSEQFSYKWSEGQLLNNHRLLVLLPLRDNRVRSVKTVRDLFQHPHLQHTIAQEVESCEGEGVALWLEAWDELEEEMREKSSLFLDLVCGRVLPRATVIITSRPWATIKLRDEDSSIQIDQHVEIVTTPQIQFSRVLREKRVGSEVRAKLIDYVKSHPSVKAAMHTPVTANIVTEVFQWSLDTESPPPTTMTQLYTAYTCKLVMQYLSTHKTERKESCKITSLEEIPDASAKVLLELSRLAWEGLLKQQLTFSSCAAAEGTLGLMEGVRELYGEEGGELTYHFIHLTLQEFLSAYHITQLPLDKQEQVIQQHLTTGHLKMVVRFYFGLNKHSLFTARVAAQHMSDCETAAAYHWLFEAGGPEELTGEVESEKAVWVKSTYEWTPLDYYVVGYCTAHYHIKWKVYFSGSSMSDEDMEMWCKGLTSKGQATDKRKKIGLYFRTNKLTLEGLKFFINIPLTILYHLSKLFISYNELDSSAMEVFCEIIPQFRSLQKLKISGNPIGCGGAVLVLKRLLHHNIPLKTLNLYKTGVGEEDCAVLSELIAHTDLESLKIGGNTLTPNSVTSIMQGLLQNNTIQELSMSGSQFSEENTVIMASVLQQPDCQLDNLDIRRCGITGDCATQLATALTHNHSLTILDMSGNPIGDSGAVSLGHMLMHNTVLRKLCVIKCGITSEGAVQLTTALSGNTTLQNFSIGENHIRIAGAEAVGKMIEENQTLETLWLDDDDSLGNGVPMILASLNKNSTLKKSTFLRHTNVLQTTEWCGCRLDICVGSTVDLFVVVVVVLSNFIVNIIMQSSFIKLKLTY